MCSCLLSATQQVIDDGVHPERVERPKRYAFLLGRESNFCAELTRRNQLQPYARHSSEIPRLDVVDIGEWYTFLLTSKSDQQRVAVVEHFVGSVPGQSINDESEYGSRDEEGVEVEKDSSVPYSPPVNDRSCQDDNQPRVVNEQQYPRSGTRV
jgi:hypothetical protein